jgi:type III secretion protein U
MSEKTEQPTPKKLRDARAQGQVCKSQEVTSAAGLITVFGFLFVAWNFWEKSLRELFALSFSLLGLPFREALPQALAGGGHAFLLLVIPVLALVVVSALVANLGQVGFLFSLKAAKPGLDKINPKQWFSKVFARKNFLELAKSILKTLLLAWMVQKIILESIDSMIKAPAAGLASQLGLLSDIFFSLYLYCGGTFAAVAALDYILQKKIYLKDQMMTKDEVKREYKEMEGDPLIKSQRRQLHQEMAMSDDLGKVRQSSVLVTNPTHVAVALYYEEGKTPLPIVTARGEGAQARRMMRAAEEAGVPIMRNVPLARGLFEQARPDNYIPGEFVEPAAEVIRWLKDMAGAGQEGESQ